MRYYVGTCEMKWSHVDRMEQIWIQRELGDELFKEIQQDWCKVVILRTDSQSLPGDIYKRCDIYVDIEDTPRATLFALQFSDKIRKVERV
jgi:hypothetical protein